MKRFLISAAAVLLSMLTISAQEFLPQWQEGYLDIHCIGTGRGDCSFIICPDGTTIIADAGAYGWWDAIPDDKETPAKRIAEYINRFSSALPKPDTADYMWITHFHADHMGCMENSRPGSNGYALSGVTELGEYIKIDKLIDRGYPTYDHPTREYVMRECNDLMEDYLKFVGYQSSRGMKAERFDVGSVRQFNLLNNPGRYKDVFEIRNMVGNGTYWTGKGKKTRKMYTGNPLLFDENMYSCGIRLRYGDFVYYNCGDLPGSNLPWVKSGERNFEKYLADVFGKTTVLKADHHGFEDSSNGKLLMETQPEAIVFISSGRGHPHVSTLRRCADTLLYEGPRDIYVTSTAPMQRLSEEDASLFKPVGHIVFRVYPGGKTWQTFVLDEYTGDYRIKFKTPVRKVTKR